MSRKSPKFIIILQIQIIQGRNKIPITGGARYLFIFPTSEAYIGSHIPLLGSSEETGGAMALPAPPVPMTLLFVITMQSSV